jgi:hypothetical protein
MERLNVVENEQPHIAATAPTNLTEAESLKLTLPPRTPRTPDMGSPATKGSAIDANIAPGREGICIGQRRPLLRSARYSSEMRKNMECTLMLAAQEKIGLNPYGFHSQEHLVRSFEDIDLAESTLEDDETPAASESPALDW